MILLPRVLHKLRQFAHKFVETTKTQFYVQQLFSENRAIYETMWKNMVQPEVT
jgi:hypothetical protein